MAGQEGDALGPDDFPDEGGSQSGPIRDRIRGMFEGKREQRAAQQSEMDEAQFEFDKEQHRKANASHKGPFQNVDQIGQKFSQRLLERLSQPVEQSQAFFFGSKAIRDSLSVQSTTARQRLGDQAQTGGFLGSGAVQQGNIDILRGESFAYSQGIRDLFLQLEDRREQDILPFLAQASGRQLELRAQNIEKRGQNMALAGAGLNAIGSAASI